MRSINEETADETSKILNELSACQQRCANMAAELSCKEQMVALLRLQVGDLNAAAASTASNGASQRTSPARPVPAAALTADSVHRPTRPAAVAAAAAVASVRLEMSTAAREVSFAGIMLSGPTRARRFERCTASPGRTVRQLPLPLTPQ